LSKNRDPFGLVLRTLRDRLRAGVYPGGAPLTIIDLAREFSLSPTPVREALSRLAGQGLVEDVPGKGYFVRLLQPGDLVELLVLHQLYVTTGLESAERHQQGVRPSGPLVPPPLPDLAGETSGANLARVLQAEAYFEFIVLQAGNAALLRALRRLADRLAPARHNEHAVIADVDGELGELATLLAANHWDQARGLADRYHHRRMVVAANIAAASRLGREE
jgi:DNA-binding transcriptional MocR family regulator